MRHWKNFSNNNNNNNSTSGTNLYRYDYLYENLEKYFLSWYLPLTIVVGTIGGLFCLIFLIYSRLFSRHVLIWMVCICVGDLLVLHLDAMRMTIKVWRHDNFDIRDVSTAWCRGHLFASNYFLYWSGYIQACLSIQRLIHLRFPMQWGLLINTRVVTLSIVIVSVVLVVPNMPYLLLWHLNPNNDNDCEPILSDYYTIISLVDLIVWQALPVSSMIVSTTLIIIYMQDSGGCPSKFNRFLNSPMNTPAGETISNSSSDWNKITKAQPANTMPHAPSCGEVNRLQSVHMKVAASASRRPSSGLQRHGNSSSSGNVKHVTRLLICMNLFYIASTSPNIIYCFYINVPNGNKLQQDFPQKLHKFFYYLLRSLVYLNSSVNFVFYCFAGTIFRERAIRVCRDVCLRLTRPCHTEPSAAVPTVPTQEASE